MPTPRQGYYIDGERVPSVTQVLGITAFTPSDALCGWAAKLAKQGKEWKQERARLGMVGSCIHDAIEAIPNLPVREKGDNAKLNDDEWLRVMTAWECHSEWVERRRPKVMLQELQLLSKDLRCGGTPDLVVRIDVGGEEKPFLTDHKSGGSIGAKEVSQLAAYAHMVEETCHVELAGAIVFHHPSPEKPAGKLYIRETGKPFRAIPIAPSVLKGPGLRSFRAARELYDVSAELRAAVGVEDL